jgi:hypothetical protein
MRKTPSSPPRASRCGWNLSQPGATVAFLAVAALTQLLVSGGQAAEKPARPIDFNREIRPVLSNYCVQCHGPDASKRKGVSKPLRLDTEAGALADLGGYQAIVPGNPDESEAIQRILSDDPTETMPPPRIGKKLTAREVELLTAWVKQGAPYARHWSYVKPVRSPLPKVSDPAWPRNAIDRFILARLDREGLKPAAEADRYSLIRRLSLDLTGLPPSLEEVDAFVRDSRPDAYEKLVDRLLDKQAYGEHWARMWLDLARYADSAGYADDPPRTIWAYRDYVIRSLNANKPFDTFTIEQIAGDLLPSPTEDQLIATAFHRNTLTNNEGGTNDEEFRNVAVVDRVNTTMAVWMGTTIACAQCHDHKYDPISQNEFFRFMAFFNNTEDADRKDESPLLSIYSPEQKQKKAALEHNIARLEQTLQTPTPELRSAQERWESSFAGEVTWQPLEPSEMQARSGAVMTRLDDKSVLVSRPGKTTDVYTVALAPAGRLLSALRIEALPHDSLPEKGPGFAAGKFAVTRVRLSVVPAPGSRPVGRYVRVELPGKEKILSLAEVQVYSGKENVARQGAATQSSTAFDGPPALAIDGKTDGRFNEARSTTHTEASDNPWWELDLKSARPIDRIAVWNRTDGNLQSRLAGARVVVLDADRQVVWTEVLATAPQTSAELSPGGARAVALATALVDEKPVPSVLEDAKAKPKAARGPAGWISGAAGQPQALTLVPAEPVKLGEGDRLSLVIEQLPRAQFQTIGRFRVSATDDERASESVRTPARVFAILKTDPERRTEAERAELARHYRTVVSPELKPVRERLSVLRRQLAAIQPVTTVPIQHELAASARRKTQIQRRGNFLDLGAEVSEGVPEAFHPLPKDAPRNRLTLARWLVDENNPLTARVIVNRYWEQVFGAGLVPTSEEFGSQGEPPTHPELLDWLATELMRERWDLKQFLKLLVTSATYRQDSRVTPEALARDGDNALLGRGPRFRLSAEMIRDQALAVSGLLSEKLYGPPVKPPQPSSGLNAAFGGGIDWQTSMGGDRYRRGLYTTWRRSNPYPSMTTFDAPNRETCTLRRTRTNTPLQALVTLNDPVFIEAAQALARRIAAGGETTAARVRHGFRLCLARPPADAELDRLVRLYETAHATFAADRARASKLATDPLGPAPKETDVVDLASWTVVSNVLLNLDEMLMKR